MGRKTANLTKPLSMRIRNDQEATLKKLLDAKSTEDIQALIDEDRSRFAQTLIGGQKPNITTVILRLAFDDWLSKQVKP
jgi:hypothetical protein